MEERQKYEAPYAPNLQQHIGVPGIAMIIVALHEIINFVVYLGEMALFPQFELGIYEGVEYALLRGLPVLLSAVLSFLILQRVMYRSSVFFRSRQQLFLFVLVWVLLNVLPYILGLELIRYINDYLIGVDGTKMSILSFRNGAHMLISLVFCLLSLWGGIAVFSGIWKKDGKKIPVQRNIWASTVLTALSFFFTFLLVAGLFWETSYSGDRMNAILMILITESSLWVLFLFLPAGMLALVCRKKKTLFSDAQAILGGCIMGICVPLITVGLLWMMVVLKMFNIGYSPLAAGSLVFVLFYTFLLIGCFIFRAVNNK